MPYVHHTIIHFVVALSLVAAALHIVASLKGGSGWADSSRLLTFLATAAALVAAGSGLLSAGHAVERGGDADKIAMHRNVALAATALMVIGAIAVWRLARQASVVNAWLARGFLLAAAAAAGFAAHLGGDMLHPGLAPWSSEPHHHGPQGSPTDSGTHPPPPSELEHAGQQEVRSVTDDKSNPAPEAGTNTPGPTESLGALPESSAPPLTRPPARRPVAETPKPTSPKPTAPAAVSAAPPGHEGHAH